MPNRLPAFSADDSSAFPAAISFAFADSLPASDWAPPETLLLYEAAANEAQVDGLALPPPCQARATTQRLGL
jgi:hypothetical protein